MAASQSDPTEKFRCRKCRYTLFKPADLSEQHIASVQCNSWFLRDDEMILPWVQSLVDEVGWTEGKLYCPKCNARIGGFDFLHVVKCACQSDVIPAIWLPKSKVDHITKLLNKGEHEVIKHDAESNQQQGIHKSGDCKFAFGNGSNKTENHCHENFQAPQEALQTVGSETLLHTHEGIDHHFHIKNQCSCRFNFMHYSIDSKKLDVQTDYSNCLEMQPTISSIHEKFQEIRREVIELGSEKTEHGTGKDEHSKQSAEFGAMRKLPRKRKNKTRRRGRGSWECQDCLDASSATNYRSNLELTGDNYTKWVIKRSSDHNAAHLIAPNATSVLLRTRESRQSKEILEVSDSEIPDHFKCSVCLCLLYKPYRTPCSHVFCGVCLRQLNSVTHGEPKCPLCRKFVTDVESEEDIRDEIKKAYPANYRKRAKEIRRNKHRKSPLPSPESTAFDQLHNHQQYHYYLRLADHISIAALIISVVVNSFLMRISVDARARRELCRLISYAFLILIAVTAFFLVSILLIIFAFDFFKIAAIVVLSYVALSKVILSALM